MRNLSPALQNLAYWASLLLVGSVPGLFLPLADTTLGSANRILGGGVVLLWILSVSSRGEIRRLHLVHWLALTFSLWYTLSVVWSVVPGDSPFPLNVGQGAALTILLWDILRTRAQVDAALQAFLLGGYISITTTALNFLNGAQARHWEKRFAGSGFDPNDIALLLAIGIPMAVYLMTRRERPIFLQALNFFYPVATGFVIILTGSRGALLAAIPAYLFFLVTVLRMGRAWRFAALAVVVGAVIGATQLDLGEPIQRLASVASSSSDDHLSGRSEIWSAGWNVYGEHPLLGVGGGAFALATKKTNGQEQELIAHNTYLSVLTELGPIGFLVFIALIAAVWRSAPRQPTILRHACLLMLLVWGIGVFALSWEFRSQTWLLFALVVAAGQARAAEGPNLVRSLV